MPSINDNDVRNMIKRSAGAQAPDAWAGIERRINAMEQNKGNQKKNRRVIQWTAGATACAAIALAAVAFAVKPAFLFGAVGTGTPAVVNTGTVAPTVAAVTPDPQVREPVPFTDSTSLQKQGGPMRDIKFFETLKEFVQNDWTRDIAEFEFIKQTGTEPAADGFALYTYYEMKVVKSFKGDLKPGDIITVRTFGGASDKVWIEDDFIERFTGEYGYVLFLDTLDLDGKSMYQLASPLQGYVPLRGGAVSLNKKIENNGLFTHGEKLEDLEKAIEEAVK